MPRSVAERLGSMHPKMLGVTEHRRRSRDEVDAKAFGEQEWRGRIGYTIVRALEIAHLTKQEMSYAMGYGSDQSSISKWASGKERPLFDKLFAAREGLGEKFYDAWVIACAETNPRLEVVTEIRVKRSA